jgi:hypothetical protein
MQTCLKKKTVGCDNNNNNGMQRRDVVWTTSLKFLHFLLVLWLFINASVRFFFHLIRLCYHCSAMQAYNSQSTSAYMPSSGFYNGAPSQTPYGVLAPSTYTTMGVPSSRALGQQCKNGQSLGEFLIKFHSRAFIIQTLIGQIVGYII